MENACWTRLMKTAMTGQLSAAARSAPGVVAVIAVCYWLLNVQDWSDPRVTAPRPLGPLHTAVRLPDSSPDP